MPWKLKYQNYDDDLVSVDFQKKTEMDEYIQEHGLERACKVTEQIKSVIPAEKQ